MQSLDQVGLEISKLVVLIKTSSQLKSRINEDYVEWKDKQTNLICKHSLNHIMKFWLHHLFPFVEAPLHKICYPVHKVKFRLHHLFPFVETPLHKICYQAYKVEVSHLTPTLGGG